MAIWGVALAVPLAALAVHYPLPLKVQLWPVGLSVTSLLMFPHGIIKRWLFPRVIASVLLAFAAGSLSGEFLAAVGFLLYGVFTVKGLGDLLSKFDPRVMLVTAVTAFLAIWAIIEILS